MINKLYIKKITPHTDGTSLIEALVAYAVWYLLNK